MIKSNGGIIGPDNVTTGGPFGSASGVFKLGEVTNLIKDSKWPSIGPAGFQVANSCRFNDGSSDYLNRATSDPQSSNTTATYSVWIKRTTLGTDQCIWSGSYYSNDNVFQLKFLDSDKLSIYSRRGASTKANLTTAQVFRDTSAWYNIVIAIDTTQGTEANRIKCYVNGELATVTGSYPSVNENLYIDSGAGANYYIGRRGDSAEYFDGYIAEFVYVDGTQYANTNFGETNSQTGIWVPKDISGLTFGTKGLYLDFKDSSALGNDVSGNNHDFTVNNLTSIDQSTDSCTNNFAIMNALDNYPISTPGTFSEGNLQIVSGQGSSSSNGYSYFTGIFGLSTGKWYWEAKCTDTGAASLIGIVGKLSDTPSSSLNNNTYGYTYRNSDGQIYNNGSGASYGNTYGTSDIIGIALDLDNNKLYFSKNGTFQNSGDPTSGATGTGAKSITAAASTNTGFYFPVVGDTDYSDTSTWQLNFGGGSPISVSSGNADGNGFGNFEYAVPSGFLALCTNNLNA